MLRTIRPIITILSRYRFAALMFLVAMLPVVFASREASLKVATQPEVFNLPVPTRSTAGSFLSLQGGPCALPANEIVAENCKPGNPATEWDISGSGDSSIQGFATDISVDQGQTVHFKIKTTANNYRLDIYRMGYYGGAGARKVGTVQVSQSQTQPACLTNSTTGLIDCGNWAESASWAVPADAVSGIYFSKLTRTDTGGASHIIFIVRDDDGSSDLLFQTSDTTWQAYNEYGGNSLYLGGPGINPGRAYKVSYNRPFITRGSNSGEDWLFNSEYPMVRWLEANGYDVSYFTGVDADRFGPEINDHKVYLSVGHDEYWSGGQRANVEAARNSTVKPVHLAFFSGNEIFWKTRWESSIDGSNTPFRTLVSYKETHANAKIDPLPNVWTGTWRDARFSPPADGGRPENALSGNIFMVNGERNDAIAVPAADGKMRFWRNTTIATLAPGAIATLPTGTLGYEWDEELDNGSRPAGLFRLSSNTVTGAPLLQDNGSNYATGTAKHNMSLYRYNSGALVFAAGTVQWSWGLDSNHDRGSGVPTDQRMQQATVNLLADMGTQPASLQTGLVAATATTDATAPTSTITSPTNGGSVQLGIATTITGTASDVGGGVIGGVEVSTDGGNTWHPANGRESWTYNWTPGSSGAATIKSRAVDDSGNLETPSAGVTVSVVAASCPCSVWSDATLPSRQDSDTVPTELGFKFRADTNGYITAIRFYKHATNTGVHVGSLWNSTGTKLGSATFSNETTSGWQQMSLPSPVPITANTTYIASYHTNVGRYAVDSNYFANSGVTNGPLTALRNGVDGGNGVYAYGANSVFPNQSYQSENTWTDIVFVTSLGPDTTPPLVSATSPANGASAVALSANITATFNEAMDASTFNANTFELRNPSNSLVTAAITYDSVSKTATLDPTANLSASTTYTATLKGGATDPRVKDQAGNALASNFSWSFTTATVDTTPPTVTAVTPPSGATGVSVAINITATFSEAMDATTINSNTFELRDPANNLVAAAITYDAATRTTTLDPTANLTASTTYTATVKGGATDPRVKDQAGNALATNFSWSFTTAAGPACPCSIWNDTTIPAGQDSDNSAIEVGFKFRSDTSGYISALRFYKHATNTGVHVGSLWNSTGTKLGSATFTNETTSGWQQVSLPSPVPITANTTYIASYHTNVGRYAVNSNYFANSGVTNGPLTALRNGVDGGNGVYAYGANSVFPNQSYQSENTWTDIVFVTSLGPDTTPPLVSATSPANGASAVALSANITATFNEAMDASTFNANTFELRNPSNSLVTAAITYDSVSKTATLDPTANLSASTTYTATLKGGATDPRVKDQAGNALASNFSWSFTTATVDTTPPTVTAVTPPSGATGVSAATNITATFSEAMDATTINSNTFELRNPANNLVAAAITYDAATRATTLDPTANLAASTTYTATVKGGATDPRVKDQAGNALATNFSWSFTTAAGPACPCSIWNDTTIPAGQDSDPNSIEVGVKFRSDTNGYISGLRFYKHTTNTGVHVASLWTSTGTKLASATFNNETASGWQQVGFASPVAVTANTTYVASYHTNVGRYAVNGNFFANAGVTNGPLTALRNGIDGGNGVYAYGANTLFPNQTYQTENYWVDVVFITTLPPDTTPPTVTSSSPANGSAGLRLDTIATVSFSEQMDPATINSSTFELRDSSNTLVPADVTIGGETGTVTLDPISSLVNSMTYTATVRGGTTEPRVKDLAGNALAANVTWSFTTTAAPPPPPNEGPGGPILVVGWSSNPFTRYYAEILRAEGLNEFTVNDISSVSATTLAAYDVVILGDMPLSAAQVTMFSNWVNAGGNLIAMHPDKQLAGLLGLTAQPSFRLNAYLQVDTTSGPGVGITNQTIQFHGTADLYNLAGAASLATIYSNAVTPTTNPAVTLVNVGTNGGQAAAFTYDLARSIVYTRQGNPFWSGQERDGSSPIRSDDLFFGASALDMQPDWVDFNKIAVPQADEQQRLLANLILFMNRDRKPLPRFWYLPRGGKAVIVMTGDDHQQGGTAGRFDQYKASNPAGCSVANWECIRATSYMYVATPISNAQAAAYNADGFEIALHVNTNCADWASATDLQNIYTSQLNSFKAKYTSLPLPVSNRTHCVAWGDYATQPQVELSNGIRFDTNYYYYPATWVQNRPGLFTGSAMPMRFADLSGNIIDVYQATTQMTDESNQTYPLNVNALLDKALGPEGYYGVFTANMHNDMVASSGADAIINSAQTRGVPVVSSRQMLEWLDGRNGSSFVSPTWDADSKALSFTISIAAGSNGLQAMLPVSVAVGSLTSITLNGNVIAFTVQTIKGIDYAFFSAGVGTYRATYAP